MELSEKVCFESFVQRLLMDYDRCKSAGQPGNAQGLGRGAETVEPTLSGIFKQEL